MISIRFKDINKGGNVAKDVLMSESSGNISKFTMQNWHFIAFTVFK